jgi:hypothetical protein
MREGCWCVQDKTYSNMLEGCERDRTEQSTHARRLLVGCCNKMQEYKMLTARDYNWQKSPVFNRIVGNKF